VLLRLGSDCSKKCGSYYPFGMSLPGGSWSLGTYRYGYQGQESDKETDSYAFEHRVQNPQTGRFWTPDPLEKQYPGSSTYAFAENDVIRSIDMEGLEKVIVITSPYVTKEIAALQKADKVTVNNKIIRKALYALVRAYPNDYYLRKFSPKGFRLPNENTPEGYMYNDPNVEGTIVMGTVVERVDADGTQHLKQVNLFKIPNMEPEELPWWDLRKYWGKGEDSKTRKASKFEKWMAKNGYSADEMRNLVDAFGEDIPDVDVNANQLDDLPSGDRKAYKSLEYKPKKDSGKYYKYDEGWKIGPIMPSGGIDPTKGRKVKDKKDSTKYKID
jgi:RHS repeat-associated protein